MDQVRPDQVGNRDDADLAARYAELELRVTQFSVVEQKLVAVRQRLDRQISVHTRMQHFNAKALRESEDSKLSEIAVEGLVDAFEVEIGLVLSSTSDPLEELVCHGISDQHGRMLAAGILARPPASRGGRIWSGEELAAIVPEVPWREALVWQPPLRRSAPGVLLVAANTQRGVASFEALDEALIEAVTVFAQQVEAHHLSYRARQALRASEERTRSIIQSALDAVVVLDERGVVTDWNPVSERMFGWARSEVLGRALGPLILPPGAGPAGNDGADAFLSGAGLVLNERLEITAVRRSGERFPAEISVASIREGHSRLFSLFLRDLSEARRAEERRRQLERELQQAQKLETLGTLAGGIAHDFNNILAGVIGFVELAEGSIPPDHRATRLLQQARQGIFRARDLVKRLLLFARRVPPGEQVVVDLCRLIHETLPLVRAATPSTINLERPSPFPGCKVRGDEGQLQQVLLNLCINGAHAIGDRPGTVRIDFGPWSDPERPDGPPMLRLAVIDDGCGMEAATVGRIFDPFFTTKGVRGTGLGLSIVQGIVQQHGGRIQVRSEPGRGTTMEVLLPAAEPVPSAPGPAAAVTAAAPAPSGAGRTVLLADDEETIRMILATYLEDEGFKVLECADGNEAQAVFAREGAGLALAVLDLTMPGRNGIELAKAFRAARPGLPILLTSGDHSRYAAEEGPALADVGRLEKPFSLEELRRAVTETLGGPGR